MKYLSYVFCILFVAGIISCKEQAEKESAAEPVIITSNGVIIDYTTCGENELSVVLVHGWCINQQYWNDQVDALCGLYNIITLDLPGFGESGANRSDWTIENYGNDIVAVIDQLKLERVVLVGHSMGGEIILEAALQRPSKVIALIGVDNFKDVGVEYGEQEQEDMKGFMEMLQQDFANIAPSYAEGMLFHSSTDSLVAARVMNDFRNANPVIAVESLQSLFNYSSKEQERLGELKQKLYLINSDATPTNIEGLDETGVSYKIYLIHATGHYPMVEKPKEFNVILKNVLNKIEEGYNVI